MPCGEPCHSGELSTGEPFEALFCRKGLDSDIDMWYNESRLEEVVVPLAFGNFSCFMILFRIKARERVVRPFKSPALFLCKIV